MPAFLLTGSGGASGRVLDVRDYGAIGDGATDDTAAIQAAVDTAEAAGGGVIHFGAGIYSITSTIDISGPSVHWIGAGHDRFHAAAPVDWAEREHSFTTASLVWDGADGGTMVLGAATDDGAIHFSVEGLNIVGGHWPYTSCADYGLKLYGVQGSRFDIHVQEFNEAGLYMAHAGSGDGATSCVFNRVVYLSGRFQDTAGAILRLDGVEDGGDVYNNVFDVIEGLYRNGTAIDLIHQDSNEFGLIRVQKTGNITSTQPSASGQPVLNVGSSSPFLVGDVVYLRQGHLTDTRTILSKGTGTITFTTNLTRAIEWGGTLQSTPAYGIYIHAVSPSGGSRFRGRVYPGAGGVYIEGTENGSTDPVFNVQMPDYDSGENTAPMAPGIGVGAQVQWGGSDTQPPGFGHMPYWYPLGYAHGVSPGTEYNLAASGGSIAIPMWAPSYGWLKRVAMLQNDTSLARSFEWGLFVDSGGRFQNKLVRVYHGFQTAGNSSSFTPTIASLRTSDTHNPHWHHTAGLYWLVIRNTHASNGFKIAAVAGTAFAKTVVRRQTGIAALGNTIDISAWSGDTALPMVRMDDEIGGENVAFG